MVANSQHRYKQLRFDYYFQEESLNVVIIVMIIILGIIIIVSLICGCLTLMDCYPSKVKRPLPFDQEDFLERRQADTPVDTKYEKLVSRSSHRESAAYENEAF